MKKEKEKNEKIKTKKARMRSIRCVGKDVALLIVRQVKHQSTRANLALVSKNFYWAVRETIEYFLKNGGIASFCINRIICTTKFDFILQPKINNVYVAVEKTKEGYYQSDILEKHRRNYFVISVDFTNDNTKGTCSTTIYPKHAEIVNNELVCVFDISISNISIKLSITLLPEK